MLYVKIADFFQKEPWLKGDMALLPFFVNKYNNHLYICYNISVFFVLFI